MAQTNTAEVALRLLLQRSGIGLYIPNGDIDALVAGSFTSALHLRNGNFGIDHFRTSLNTFIWRPQAATSPDYVRLAGALTPTSGLLANDASWTDVTIGAENIYLTYYGIHPVRIVDAFNRVARRIYFENEEPLSLAADAGFQATGVTAYTESDADGGPATTFTKITTADSFNVFPAYIGSGRILNAAANGYIRQRFIVDRGADIYVGWLARVTVGSMSLVLRDVTNAATLGTAITSTEENWQYLWRNELMTSGTAGTETLEVRLQGIGATDDIYSQALWVYRKTDRTMLLSTTWDTEFKMPVLSYLTFGKNTAQQVESGFSMQKRTIPPSDYSFLFTRPGANPYALQWHQTATNPNGNNWYKHPILIQGRRAYSDIDTTVTLTLAQTSSMDLDLWESAARVELFSDPLVDCPGKAERLAKAQSDYRGYAAQSEVRGPAQKRVPWNWVGISS